MNRRGFFRRAAAGLVVGAASLYAPRLLDTALEELIPLGNPIFSQLPGENWTAFFPEAGVYLVPSEEIIWLTGQTNTIRFTSTDLERMKNGEVALLQPEKPETEPE